MTTMRQITSNRRNARDSTGPNTRSGKARSSKNARRHGLSQPFDLRAAEVIALAQELFPAMSFSFGMVGPDVNGKAKVGQRAAQNVATLGLG